MKKLVFVLLLLASTQAFADSSPADEISGRSGLPASEVNALLADCDSNQTSMNFCAWRDQIVSERELERVVERQESEHPERKTALETRIEKWKKARDASCEKSSRQQWDGGSMRPAAQAICTTAATKKMTKKLSAMAGRKSSCIKQTPFGAAATNNRTLSGAGIGLNANVADFHIRASVALRTRREQPTSIPASAVHTPTIWAQASRGF